jgi:hypothetical protein
MNPLIDLFKSLQGKIPEYQLVKTVKTSNYKYFWDNKIRYEFAVYILEKHSELLLDFRFDEADYEKLYQEKLIDESIFQKYIINNWSLISCSDYILNHLELFDDIKKCSRLENLCSSTEQLIETINKLSVINNWSVESIIKTIDFENLELFIRYMPLEWLNYFDAKLINPTILSEKLSIIGNYEKLIEGITFKNDINKLLFDVISRLDRFPDFKDDNLFIYLMKLIDNTKFRKFREAIQHYQIDYKYLKKLYYATYQPVEVTINADTVYSLYNDNWGQTTEILKSNTNESFVKRKLIRSYIKKRILEAYD